MAVNLRKRMPREKEGRGEFRIISLPSTLVEKVEKVVESLRRWPTKTAFVREAVLEKLKRYRKEEEKPSSDRFG